nr:immunoglobulin light chain junction region [Macaca mulatta]
YYYCCSYAGIYTWVF